MNNDVFTETQSFRKSWRFYLLGAAVFMVILFMFKTLPQIKTNNINYFRQIITPLFGLLAIAVTYSLTFTIVIDEEGIKYKWAPFMFSYTVLPWKAIESVNVRSYRPLAEFGGWGFKFNFKETAYTVSGDQGIEIKKHGKKRLLLLGTAKSEEAKFYINQYSPEVENK